MKRLPLLVLSAIIFAGLVLSGCGTQTTPTETRPSPNETVTPNDEPVGPTTKPQIGTPPFPPPSY